MLLNDPRLPAVVDDIVVEFGNAIYQTRIDRFIAGQPVENVDLRPVWRNTTQSPLETWDEPVYEQFYRTVRAANWALREGKQMRVLLGDPPIDWSRTRTIREWVGFLNQRDTHAAAVVEKQVLAKGRRALLCHGAEHLLRVPGNLVSIIEKRTGERTYQSSISYRPAGIQAAWRDGSRVTAATPCSRPRAPGCESSTAGSSPRHSCRTEPGP